MKILYFTRGLPDEAEKEEAASAGALLRDCLAWHERDFLEICDKVMGRLEKRLWADLKMCRCLTGIYGQEFKSLAHPKNLLKGQKQKKRTEMAPERYRKKPIEIEAMQFIDTTECLDDLSNWGLDPVRVDYANPKSPVLKIETLEGLMQAHEGDYIIKGIHGEFYPCKPDIFLKTYEKVQA